MSDDAGTPKRTPKRTQKRTQKQGAGVNLTELLERAKTQLATVTGLKPMAVTGAHRDDEGWRVSVEMLEMARIPPATDVVGEYTAQLSQEGDLLRFERRRTRLRGEPRETESD